MTELPAVADLRSHLDTVLGGAARAWLDQATDEATTHASAEATEAAETTGVSGAEATGPAEAAGAVAGVPPGSARPSAPATTPVWELRFAEAGRRCGPDHADTARLLLLYAAHAGTGTLTRLYEQGTATERRAVLRSLPRLVPGPDALPLIEDALRTNDTRLVAAALGPYAATHLAPHDWRQAVLKCLFTGVPVDAVAGLARRARADAELARMLGDYADERTAAGRKVPGDLYRVLALTDPSAANGRGAPAPTGTDGQAPSGPDGQASADTGGPDGLAPTSQAGPTAPAPIAAPSTSTGEEQES
ncbi:EboA domain-containing protein [Streptomyces lasiicapitis]|uniref:Sugar phosphate isomerase n=1 Tax=Streptomyces lasiicapitis TaxID=1923961 RepID=A0ABQ2LK02_9ACTN|nr:EboA domain-containing protein [Streptomyces lasiicapitis]GGO36600.1 hypothetical protein GCM10012286_08870 [Streptomyces lasiicapitis]